MVGQAGSQPLALTSAHAPDGSRRGYQKLLALLVGRQSGPQPGEQLSRPHIYAPPPLSWTSAAADRAVELERSWKANLDPPLRASASRA
jgi:hypothetical protein